MAGSREPFKVESSALDHEQESLLPQYEDPRPLNDYLVIGEHKRSKVYQRVYLAVSFLGGVAVCLVAQLLWCYMRPADLGINAMPPARGQVEVFAPPYAGSSEVHNFPPASPTNNFPSLFPTNVGYAGPTPTGAEPSLIVNAPSYPVHTGAPHLVSPFAAKKKNASDEFDLFQHWGNLSPWFSVKRGAFGLDSDPATPETCEITGLHLLHRHGARYPTQYGNSEFLSFMDDANIKSKRHTAVPLTSLAA